MTERIEPDRAAGRRLLVKLPHLLVIAAIGAIGGVLLVASSRTAEAQSTKSITEDRSTYYRLKAKLAYKGEPQDFDIVVGCNVRQIFYKEGGRTYEAGLTPTVFGRRMGDGKVLVVRPPNACRGETTDNGRVQPDLLPLVIVYDNADRLDFGIAYLSEDAYESPLSELKFDGATIEKATRVEFDRFRASQPNAVKRELYHSALASDRTLKELNLPRVERTWAHVCEGYKRYLLGDRARSLLREHWPEGRPRYWQTNYDVERTVAETIFDRRTPVHSDTADRAPHIAWSFGDGAADIGLPTLTGGGLVAKSRGNTFAAAYYPAASDYRADKWPANKDDLRRYLAAQDQVADMHVRFQGGAARGFAYCFTPAFPDDELKGLLSDKRRVARVDGEPVVTPRAPAGRSSESMVVLERDEFVFHFFRIYLESTRGDV
jgi:hypothetical protein